MEHYHANLKQAVQGSAIAIRGTMRQGHCNLQVERQAGEIAELLSGAGGFSRLRSDNAGGRGIGARRAVAQALAALRRLGDVLADVLPPRAFVGAAGAAVEALAGRAVGEGCFVWLLSAGRCPAWPSCLCGEMGCSCVCMHQEMHSSPLLIW